MKVVSPELGRYLVNGLVSTAAHFMALYLCMEVLALGSAGVANLLASMVGITVSFLGNRYFVFKRSDASFWTQAAKFAGLYAAIALLHGTLLYVWTDRLGLDYRVGFLIAVVMQVALGYLAGKYLVFARPTTHPVNGDAT